MASWTCLAIGLLAAPAWGNGGGYRFGVDFTGGISPFEPSGTENVRILDEKLDIRLEADHAKVEVRYRMKNEADSSVKVRFGFPVEVVHDDMMNEDGSSSNPGKGGTEKVALKYCKGYSVTADKPLEVKYLPEPFAEGKVKAFPGSDKLAGIQGWEVSELKFDKGQEREIVIRYDSTYDKSEMSISEDYDISPLTFRYRLSTGGVWKDTIAKGQVTVTAAGVDGDELVIRKPAGRFGKQGGAWVWNFENLEPTLDDDLVIEAVPGRRGYGNYDGDNHIQRSYEQRTGVWCLVSNDYAATASSTLAKQGKNEYSASNLGPGNHDENHSIWSEGVEGDGIGEFLLLKPTRQVKLYAVSISPGYAGVKDLFEANNRPSMIEIVLNDDFKMPVTLRDSDDRQFFRIKGYDKPVKSVKLVIRGVYKGKKWQDTCISSVMLHEMLDKEPKVQGAR
ncbi:hypothetical protein llg_10760 [Luteolibacter sp. LG18]|nr:hypothetical protein llg_10760 [Luteolibacter sp. LG18]